MRLLRRLLPTSVPDFGADLHPVLQRVYGARAVSSAEQLETGLNRLAGFEKLAGIERATQLLHEALEAQVPILIVGDFDADGATSAALMVKGLTALGAQNVGYLVPNRFEFGYGLSPQIVEVALRQKPSLLVTVDNGITSVDGVALARANGVQVIVTDHHLPGAELPDADAIVNPNLAGDEFPSKNLAGVGVAFYLLVALRARLRDRGWFDAAGIKPANLAELLDLVALGTVADVVPLDRNNRILVAQGLARIRAGRCRPGIRALLTAGGRTVERAVASDLGFAAGPRLNAAGRLTDMSLGVECLLSDTEEAAGQMASELQALNLTRREIEADMSEEALSQVDAMTQSSAPPPALALFKEDWHPGVVGIVASRVKDRVHRPVVAFAQDGEHRLKGSARSIPGLHIKDALERVAAQRGDLIERFGGHAMAAGLTIASANLSAFREAFEQVVMDVLGPDGSERSVLTDGSLKPAELNLQLASALRAGGPWGQGFEEPQFDGEFEVRAQRIVGERHLKLKLRMAGSNRDIDAIAFGLGLIHPCPKQVRAVYRLDVNEYRGTLSPQLVVEHLASV
ncbi:MAG: single-stranded-DNA-specific exonuclease RecJ [Chromatiales bacterium]|nr:single-stranded-DNA-specific exonuclease RecJ [Chromatiales bacterium]